MSRYRRCWQCGLVRVCRIFARDRDQRKAENCQEFRYCDERERLRGNRMIEFIANNSEKILPAAMILLSIGAAIGYAVKGDHGRAMYWICAAGLTMTLTFFVR